MFFLFLYGRHIIPIVWSVAVSVRKAANQKEEEHKDDKDPEKHPGAIVERAVVPVIVVIIIVIVGLFSLFTIRRIG